MEIKSPPTDIHQLFIYLFTYLFSFSFTIFGEVLLNNTHKLCVTEQNTHV